MRIGIISDIHGDYETLIQTLDRLRGHHQVDRILCAGDLVGRGPQEDRVVELIRSREIITVRGNHDEWYYDTLSDDNVAFLKQLPLEWRGEFDGLTLYMCHGKPGNNMWGMYRDHLSETYLHMVLSSLKVDVMVTGHTHMPLFMQVDRGCLVNPGSLYAFENNRHSSHSYGVISLPDMNFEVFDSQADDVAPVTIEYEENRD